MFKQTVIAASALVAAVFAFQPQQAQAGTKVRVHIGVPAITFYSGHRHHYRGYRHHYRGHRHHYRSYGHYGRPAYVPRQYTRVGCRQAKRILQGRGFRDIRSRDCYGARYIFKARRHGHWWLVRVSSYNGQVLGAQRI